MTREEALEYLKDFKDDQTWDGIPEEALDMAIKELEQEPCDKYIKEIDHLRKYIYKLETQIVEQEPTTKNDLGVEYISRSELMAILSDYYDTTVEYRSMLKEIAALPSVTPQEPKTGHWIFVGEENEEETRNGNFRYICSKCGYSDVHAKSTEVPYCWHCGAKMVDPQESEEP